MILFLNKKKSFIPLIISLGSFLSCNTLEKSIPSASYIHIDSISFHTDYATQGSNSSTITDAWVFYDNKYLGTFPLPADIPIIGEGVHHISVNAGITENGIAALRSAYTKYNGYDSLIALSPTSTASIIPKTSYKNTVQFVQIEDFDDASLSFVTTSASTATLSITSLSDPNALEGNSGLVVLDGNHTVFEAASSNPFVLPLTTPSYLELNYKNDVDFTIGVFETTNNNVLKNALLSVRSTSSWKKIYVNLSTLGGVTSNGLYYKIYIYAEKPTTLTSANLYFDNLKVVY
jgi:hypothetical protein